MRLLQKPNSAEGNVLLRHLGSKELQDEILRAKADYDTACMHFEHACDPDLIDSCIYAENAAWKRYCFLVRQARLI